MCGAVSFTVLYRAAVSRGTFPDIRWTTGMPRRRSCKDCWYYSWLVHAAPYRQRHGYGVANPNPFPIWNFIVELMKLNGWSFFFLSLLHSMILFQTLVPPESAKLSGSYSVKQGRSPYTLSIRLRLRRALPSQLKPYSTKIEQSLTTRTRWRLI